MLISELLEASFPQLIRMLLPMQDPNALSFSICFPALFCSSYPLFPPISVVPSLISCSLSKVPAPILFFIQCLSAAKHKHPAPGILSASASPPAFHFTRCQCYVRYPHSSAFVPRCSHAPMVVPPLQITLQYTELLTLPEAHPLVVIGDLEEGKERYHWLQIHCFIGKQWPPCKIPLAMLNTDFLIQKGLGLYASNTYRTQLHWMQVSSHVNRWPLTPSQKTIWVASKHKSHLLVPPSHNITTVEQNGGIAFDVPFPMGLWGILQTHQNYGFMINSFLVSF